MVSYFKTAFADNPLTYRLLLFKVTKIILLHIFHVDVKGFLAKLGLNYLNFMFNFSYECLLGCVDILLKYLATV